MIARRPIRRFSPVKLGPLQNKDSGAVSQTDLYNQSLVSSVVQAKLLACCYGFMSEFVTSANIITSAEREVKVSRRSGMYQSYNFLTRLGMQSLKVFGFIRLFYEVRAELNRDISRSLRFL